MGQQTEYLNTFFLIQYKQTSVIMNNKQKVLKPAIPEMEIVAGQLPRKSSWPLPTPQQLKREMKVSQSTTPTKSLSFSEVSSSYEAFLCSDINAFSGNGFSLYCQFFILFS